MAQLHSRRIKDAAYITTATLAQAGVNSTAFDLEQVQGGLIEGIQLEVAVPSVAGIADTKVLTFVLQDSADGSSFAAVDPGVSTTITAASGAGTAAKTVEFPLPPNTRRYVRVAQTATATAGTFTGAFTASLLF
jgi:hypothetical protein